MCAHTHIPCTHRDTQRNMYIHMCAHHVCICVHNPQAAEDFAHTCEEEAAARQPLEAPLSMQDPVP